MKFNTDTLDVFNINEKPSEVFDFQMEILGKPEVHPGFLNDSEIKKLIELEKGKPDSMREHRPTPDQTTVTFDNWSEDVQHAFPQLTKVAAYKPKRDVDHIAQVARTAKAYRTLII